MNQIVKKDEGALSPSQQFRVELDKMGEQFAAALPSHIKPEKFQRVVMTAVLSDPEILKADRKTLMESAIRAAQDGLLPDKREGAFVVFNTKVKTDGKDVWIKAVQWMPMVAGIIKRIHQSGDIKMLTARVVYGGDHFRTWIDDAGEHVEYEPAEDQDEGIVRRVFAMATTTEGGVYVEPLSAKDVEKIRNVSKQKDRGPWSDWWEEMAKKSAIRRLAKRLPLSVDLHDLIQRDNALFDLQQEQPRDITPAKPSLSDRLAQSRSATEKPVEEQEGFQAVVDQPRQETASEDAYDYVGDDDDFPGDDTAKDHQPQQGLFTNNEQREEEETVHIPEGAIPDVGTDDEFMRLRQVYIALMNAESAKDVGEVQARFSRQFETSSSDVEQAFVELISNRRKELRSK